MVGNPKFKEDWETEAGFVACRVDRALGGRTKPLSAGEFRLRTGALGSREVLPRNNRSDIHTVTFSCPMPTSPGGG